MKSKLPKDLGLKMARDKTHAHWIKVLENLEQEEISLKVQVDMNKVLLAQAREKAK